ncbi:excisionase family DNA binding protein [Actinocorallia herbida]|uniref:Excisionase family DNA binding protein n=1 Tax=Actinocorallia herbida TaxID=58109 RepID=A0A3N1D3P0_9ACTN|nr:helix-turn-helix domain-containing protein [Actinocorallia herbida]ROO88116.1 excisionase family DNA binding protein [Actinocorallia herbida]
MNTEDQILTTTELAAKIGLSPQTVRRMANAGQLPGLKSGRDYRFLWAAVKAELRNPGRALLPDADVDQMLTTTELADRLGLSPQTIRRMAHAGTLPALKAGTRDFRFSWEAVKARLWQPITTEEDPTAQPPHGAGFRAQRRARASDALD